MNFLKNMPLFNFFCQQIYPLPPKTKKNGKDYSFHFLCRWFSLKRSYSPEVSTSRRWRCWNFFKNISRNVRQTYILILLISVIFVSVTPIILKFGFCIVHHLAPDAVASFGTSNPCVFAGAVSQAGRCLALARRQFEKTFRSRCFYH